MRYSPVYLTDTVFKPADQSVTSSTTLAADNDLVVPVKAGGVYSIDSALWLVGATTGDFVMKYDVPAGSEGSFAPACITLGNSDGTGSIRLTAVDFSASIAMGTIAAGSWVLPHGVLIAGADGNLQLTWAQNVSDPTATTVKKGSWMRVARIG